MRSSKLHLVSFLIFIFSGFCSAQIFDGDGDFHLAVEPIFGWTSGQLNEEIYHSTNKNKKISLLEWERNLWLYGVKVETQYKNFHLDLGFDTSIRKKCGEMRDSDWLNTANYDMKTTYSVGDVEAVENYDCKASFSFDAVKTKDFYISPEVSVQYQYDSFSRGRDAEGWYGQSDTSSDKKDHWWYEEEAKHYPSAYYWSEEKQKYVHQVLGGVDYFRHSVFTWAGLKAGFFIEKLQIDLEMMVSPFCYLSSKDTHEQGNIFRFIQQDYFSAGKLALGLSYPLNKFLELNLNSEALATKNLKSNLYDEGWHLNKTQPGGSTTFAITTRLGCRVKIF
ncbi:MAG: omptin family outer membrane protease [Treponema sp.]|nr:omptin family outer membrane protease [Candidatus Treponema equifaecale]